MVFGEISGWITAIRNADFSGTTDHERWQTDGHLLISLIQYDDAKYEMQKTGFPSVCFGVAIITLGAAADTT